MTGPVRVTRRPSTAHQSVIRRRLIEFVTNRDERLRLFKKYATGGQSRKFTLTLDGFLNVLRELASAEVSFRFLNPV